jgi:glycosyltransferase involved in cell wall biosynthesis
MEIGGTETFHKTLLGRLAQDPRIDLKGLAVHSTDHCDFAAKVGCPVVAGEKPLRALAESVDVLVYWGFADPDRWLRRRGSSNRPVTVAVSHGDDRSDWTQSVMAACEAATDHFVAVDQAAVGSLPSARRPDATIIPNAVDPARVQTDRSRSAIRQSLGLASDDVAILFLARLSEEKRPTRAIEAVLKLDPGYKLLVAGDGPDSQACAELARGFPRIKLLGARHDVAELLSAADLFLSPSRTEGFGLSVAEAMLAGVPVVATPVGFLDHSPELARIVPTEADATTWADAIAADWQDAHARAMRAETARLAIQDRYGVETHVDRWAAYLHGLGAARRRAVKVRVPLGVPHCVPCQAKTKPQSPLPFKST